MVVCQEVAPHVASVASVARPSGRTQGYGGGGGKANVRLLSRRSCVAMLRYTCAACFRKAASAGNDCAGQ